MMDDLKGKRFVASYSGGKDSMLAIHKAVGSGLEPMGLLTAYNADRLSSWFHGMSEELLHCVSQSLEIPLDLIITTGTEYAENFEKALVTAKQKGAQVCVFGDIDIDGHLQWCTERCEKTGLIPYFPLWGLNRKEAVFEFIDCGYCAIIKIVDTTVLPEDFLGRTLCRQTVSDIERLGADICGENGEYHTFVYDGPLFKKAICFETKEKMIRDKYAMLQHITLQN